MTARLAIPEIAERYGRSVKTVRSWIASGGWPEKAGKRGRLDEYDAAEVEAAVRRILGRDIPDDGADTGELLDMKAAAAEAGISYGTLRGYVSRGQWPAPDDEGHGVKRWRRSTVREHMASRRARGQHEARG